MDVTERLLPDFSLCHWKPVSSGKIASYLDARVSANNREIAFAQYITYAVQFLDLCLILRKAEIGSFSGARFQIVFFFHKLEVKNTG